VLWLAQFAAGVHQTSAGWKLAHVTEHLPARPISSAAGASAGLDARRWRFGGAGPHVDLRSLTVYLSRQPIQH
jgi:hypothetical protein